MYTLRQERTTHRTARERQSRPCNAPWIRGHFNAETARSVPGRKRRLFPGFQPIIVCRDHLADTVRHHRRRRCQRVDHHEVRTAERCHDRQECPDGDLPSGHSRESYTSMAGLYDRTLLKMVDYVVPSLFIAVLTNGYNEMMRDARVSLGVPEGATNVTRCAR